MCRGDKGRANARLGRRHSRPTVRSVGRNRIGRGMRRRGRADSWPPGGRGGTRPRTALQYTLSLPLHSVRELSASRCLWACEELSLQSDGEVLLRSEAEAAMPSRPVPELRLRPRRDLAVT